LVRTVSGCRKNTLGRASASSGHITILLFLDIYDCNTQAECYNKYLKMKYLDKRERYLEARQA
jgi:hypothetical protein